MEIFEEHFKNITGNLIQNDNDNEYKMFGEGAIKRHINYTSFKNAFEQLIKIKNPIIIETGSSRWGVNSTMLFDSYVRKYGGKFWSVDIDKNTIEDLKSKVCENTTMVCDDSVNFLKKWTIEHPDEKVDFVYLDSYDIDWLNPEPSQIHGLNEFLAIHLNLKNGSLLLIDDTPFSPEWFDYREGIYNTLLESYIENNRMPGKGRYVVDLLSDNESNELILKNKNVSLLHHMYQVFYKFE